MIMPGFQEFSTKTHDNEDIFYQTNFTKNLNKEKETLVLNYGLVCSYFHWRELLPFFQDNYNIVIHNYRGHYNSTGIENLENITFRNIAQDIALLCRELNIQEAAFIGHSMGVNVTVEFLRLFPQYVSKVVLISGAAIPVYNTMFNSNLVDQMIPYILKLYKKYPHALENFWKYLKFNPLIRKAVHAGGFNMDQVSDEFIEIYLSKLGELGPSLFFQLLKQMNEHNILESLHDINMPCLIIGGDNDKVIPNFNQRIFHERIKGSELFIVRDGSHVPQIDFPELINSRIQLFLSPP